MKTSRLNFLYYSKIRVFVVVSLVTLLATFISISAQPTGFSKPTKFTVLSTTVLTGIRNDLLITTSDGGVLSYGKFKNNNAIVSKLSRLGITEWENQLNIDSGIDITCMIEVAGNKYLLSGYYYSDSSPGTDNARKYATLLDKSGAIIWKMAIDTSIKQYFRTNSPFIKCRNNQYAVLADNYLNVFKSLIQPVFRFYNEDGVLLREIAQDTLFNTEYLYIRSFFQTIDGGFGVLLHTGMNDSTFQQFWRFDSGGQLLWKKVWADVPYSNVSFYSSAIESSDGSIAVATTAPKFNGDTTFIILRRFGQNGDLYFKKQYAIRDYNTVSQIVETPNRDLIMVGYSSTRALKATRPYTTADIYIIRTNYAGKIQWQETFGDSTRGEYGTSIAVVDDHTFYIGSGTGKTDDVLSPITPVVLKISDLVSNVDEQEAPSAGFHISPNPTSTSFTISGIDNISEIKVMNSLGMEVAISSESVNTNSSQIIDISTLASGVYFAQCRTATGVVTKPFVVAR